MIDERLLAQDLLDGVGVSKWCVPEHCRVLVTFWREVEHLSALQIRNNLIQWLDEHGLRLDARHNVNTIIMDVIREHAVCRQCPLVPISELDLHQITARFEDTNLWMLALAITCYAKATADEDGVFLVSIPCLANWIGRGKSTVYKQLETLREYRFVEKPYAYPEKIRSEDSKRVWVKGLYRFIPPINRKPMDYMLMDNDIQRLFEDCFWCHGIKQSSPHMRR